MTLWNWKKYKLICQTKISCGTYTNAVKESIQFYPVQARPFRVRKKNKNKNVTDLSCTCGACVLCGGRDAVSIPTRAGCAVIINKLYKSLKIGQNFQDPEKTYSGSRIQGSKRHRIRDYNYKLQNTISFLLPLPPGITIYDVHLGTGGPLQKNESSSFTIHTTYIYIYT